jgi:hypothetical protein
MDHTPVKSSHVKSVAHDPENDILEVAFHDGSIYRYHGVSKEKHEALMRASSVGKHLKANIIGVHRHSRI